MGRCVWIPRQGSQRGAEAEDHVKTMSTAAPARSRISMRSSVTVFEPSAFCFRRQNFPKSPPSCPRPSTAVNKNCRSRGRTFAGQVKFLHPVYCR